MNDLCEFDLEDTDLRAEIDLVAELMIAAAGSDDALDQQTIDAVLGAVMDGDDGDDGTPRVVAQRTPEEG